MSALETSQVHADQVAAPRQPQGRRSAWLLVVGLAVIGTMAVMLVFRGTASAGCEILVAPLAESDVFTPYELQRTKLPEVYLNPEGVAFDRSDAGLPTSVDGLSLRWLEFGGGVTAGYYDSEPIVGRPLSIFRADGGVFLAAQPVTDDVVFGESIPEEIGDRGTSVMVGERPAVLTWADPDRLGTRTHNLYWSDGETNYSLIADRPSDDLVNLARGLVCSGEL